MMVKRLYPSTYTYFFATVSFVMFLLSVTLSFKLLTMNDKPPEPCNCKEPETRTILRYIASKTNNPPVEYETHHKLAVLVPFRDRFEELMEFVPHMQKFLNAQKINYDIFVLNQVDQFRFNRASLINVGFLEIRHNYDYLVMHDVDLLPLNPDISYQFSPWPTHLAPSQYHPRYNYQKFIGGIFLLSCKDFETTQGLSNQYWGWGLEDDEFYVRLMNNKLKVYRNYNLKTGKNDTFKHLHGKHRKRDTKKCFNQREATRKRDRNSGFYNVDYRVVSYKAMEIESVAFTVINVELRCNRTVTPWCDCGDGSNKK